MRPDLAKVKEVVKYAGFRIKIKLKPQFKNWTHIDFLTTSEVNTDGSENSNNIFPKLYWDQEGVSLDWLNENAELNERTIIRRE